MKTIRNSILILLLCVVLGFVLLALAYLLPVSAMQDECYESLHAFLPEEIVKTDPLSGHDQDNFTDALLLLEAAYPGTESLTERVIGNYFLATPGLVGASFPDREGIMFFGEEYVNPIKSFLDLYGYENGGRSMSYSRYWHGYLVFLKPLLCLFNYDQIRLLYFAAETLLGLAALALLLKKAPRAAVPFALMLLLLAPSSVARSLQYASMSLLMLLSSLLLVWNPAGKRRERLLPGFFLVVGILAAYLDLLTMPSITLTVPLCLLCALDGKGRESGLKRLGWYSVLWLAGFGGMWAAKWLLAWIWQGESFLQNVLTTVSIRASASVGEESASRLGTLLRNGRELFATGWVNVLTVLYAAAAAAIGLLGRRQGWRFPTSREALRLVPPFLIPLFWILGMCNHSCIHYWFTFRTLAPCVLAVLLALTPGKKEGSGTRETSP